MMLARKRFKPKINVSVGFDGSKSVEEIAITHFFGLPYMNILAFSPSFRINKSTTDVMMSWPCFYTCRSLIVMCDKHKFVIILDSQCYIFAFLCKEECSTKFASSSIHSGKHYKILYMSFIVCT